MFLLYPCLLMLSFTSADERIIHVIPGCSSNYNQQPEPQIRVDVPASATATCKNGRKAFTTSNDVKHILDATFNQDYIGDGCLFFKKNGTNTFYINVEVAWGEEGSEVLNRKEIHTITCVYDQHGKALSSSENIGKPFIAPKAKQALKGKLHPSAVFKLRVVDVRGNELDTDHIQIGRQIRLKATEISGTIKAFRALSCFALNPVTSYAFLRAGCGDGLILSKGEGFLSDKSEVYSPFFEAFKLRGAETVKFECNFTICAASCDGDSCQTERRKRRSAHIAERGPVTSGHDLVMADTDYMWTKAANEKTISVQPLDIGNPPAQNITAVVYGGDSVQVGSPPKPRCPKFLDQHLSPEAEYTIVAVLAVFGSLLVLNFLLSLYLCCKVEVSHMERTKH